MNGFFGRVLFIDCTARRSEIRPLNPDLPARTLGGKGLGLALLSDSPADADPLGPENRLVFAVGPVTDTMVWGSSRYGVFTKSPQTGLFSESYAGGRAPEALSAAGFDAVILEGACKSPSAIRITPEGAEFFDAADLWGLSTYEAEEKALSLLAPKGSGPGKRGALVIGPAGENRVCFSVIENDKWRSAGRTGPGAVLGSKRVKALVFAGNEKRPLADPQGLVKLARDFSREAREHPAVAAYKSKGTPQMVRLMNNAGAFPTRYWTAGTFEAHEKIGARALHEACRVVPRACARCLMACGRLSTVKSGPRKGLTLEGPEYETIYAFGGLCEIDDISEILYLNDLCDRLGMDTMTAGNLAALAIEAVRRGKLSMGLDYGRPDAVAALLSDIAFRRGVGETLARGIRHAAEEWGLSDLAVHVKGLEPAGYDPRALKGMALAYAVSDRGACHLRSTFYKAELSGMTDGKTPEQVAEVFLDFENRLTLFDTLILCRFYRDLYTWEDLSDLIAVSTGLRMDRGELAALASGVTTAARRFNLERGMAPARDDVLPARLFAESLPDGSAISEEEFLALRAAYYRGHGWDEEGIP